ncbi:MAG: PIN domain-containing protein [Actinobacteria bacterium]|nr:PIN domain-containing protein [Actinomycetota bacterium]
MAEFGPALLDTDAWSRLIAGKKDHDPRMQQWRRLLEGRPIHIAAQTRGEVLFGAAAARWGVRRTSALKASLEQAGVIYPSAAVVDAWARLRADCLHLGHALHHKEHMGDAWIAATAMAFEMPLLSADRIFAGVPGLELLAEP